MVVVMLTEGCNCSQNKNLYQHIVNNVDNSGKCCPTFVEDGPPMLSGWFDNFCPACHRIVDNVGDFFVNLTGTASQFPVWGGQVTQAVTQGVGGFVKDPQNIPCAVGAVGAAFGVPTGLGGCVPQGYNEQNQTFAPEPSILSNPLILGGLGLAAYLLLTKK